MESAACVVRADTGAPLHADTVRTALFDSVDMSFAPNASNEAERMVFAQLYETLVRVDCEGNLVPGAATSWQTNDTGRSWIFALRDTLRTWDGQLLGAAEAVSAWVPDPRIDSVDTVDEHRIRIVLARPAADPRMLAGLRFALAGPRSHPPAPAPSHEWALGTGPYQPVSLAKDGTIRLVPVDSATHRPILEFWPGRGSDPRDLLERGVDLMLATDPALIDYASSRGDRTTLLLPWSRTYLLLMGSPLESLPPALAPLADSTRAPGFREALARDAVRADSRAASGQAATTRGFLRDHPSAQRLILYEPGDRTAQDLAERLVALVPRQLHWRAVAVGDSRVNPNGGSAGIVISTKLGEPISLSGSQLPLVDTRAHAILRRGSPAWVVDGDGTLRMPLPGTIPP
jgi:hypothetical protein